MPLVALLEHEPRPVENLRIEVATIVHDDHHTPTRLQHTCTGHEDAGDSVRVGRECRPRRSARRRSELALAAIVE